MKIYLSIIILILSNSLYAQSYNYEFTYSYTFKPLKSKPGKTTATAVLRAVENHSYFADYWLIKRKDLTNNKQINDQQKVNELKSFLSPGFREEIIINNDTISKFYSNYKLGYTEFTQMEDFWNILPDTDSLLNYSIQKAELNYEGRKWIAWFTADIPLSAGPYLFRGLPGLIVKIEDSELEHLFELKQVKNISSPIVKPNFRPVPKDKYKDLINVAIINSSTILKDANVSLNGVLVSYEDFTKDLVKDLNDKNYVEKK